MQKILILVTRAELGGAQNHIMSLVNNLDSEFEFVLCVGTEGVLNDVFESRCLTNYIVPSLDKKQFLRSAISINKIIQKEQPHLVHTHSAIASFVGRITAKLSRKKTLYTVHGWHFVPNAVPKRRILGPILERIAKPFTDYWITVSHYDQKLGLEKGVITPKKCTVIENGIPNKNVTQQQRHTNDKKHLLVALIGRATYQKNVLLALDILKACDPKVQLCFFSANGDHLPTLRTAIENNTFANRVILDENENNAGEQLQRFDALLMTSYYEGMPLCALEAMRAGIPIVASNVCGMDEIVHHNKNGYLFDLTNPESASQYLNRLLKAPTLRQTLGNKGQEMFKEKHLETQMTEKTRAIYNTLLNH